MTPQCQLPPTSVVCPVAHFAVVQVKGNLATSYWQFLGVWAMAGRPVKVTVPASVVKAGGAWLLVGGWTDQLYHHAQWYRLPEIARGYGIESTTTTIASATGGLVYLVLPGGLNLGRVKVRITGEGPAGGAEACCGVPPP